MNVSENLTVSVIIPTLNAEKELPVLLRSLEVQSYPITEIIIVDSSSDDQTVSIGMSYHGKTRDLVFRKSIGNIVVFLTQDAVPADKKFLGNLITPLLDPNVAVSVGRQLPKPSASKMEKLVRNFNYPAENNIRSKEDITHLGIKAFFSSNSCAAYRRDVYFHLGGFNESVRTNEDMFFAAKALQSGYCVAYTAEACVYHSHNFTLMQQYKRNYLQGYEIEKHRELLNGSALFGEGYRFVKSISHDLIKNGDVVSFIQFGLDCCARFLGNRAGRNAFRREQRKNARNR